MKKNLVELESLEIAPLSDEALASVTGGCDGGGISMILCSILLCAAADNAADPSLCPATKSGGAATSGLETAGRG